MQAVLARKEAVDLVSRLLQAPEDLKMVAAYRDDYVKQRAASKEELQGALSAQMQEIRAGIGDLGSAQKALAKFEHSFASIEVLCNECEDLLRCHESIRRLAVVHSNLRQTLQSADVIANLPRRAAEAERLLEHNTAGGFVHAYVCIAELEATAIRVQGTLDAISNQGGARPGQLPTLSSYFAQAHRAMAKLEERLWSTFRGFRDMACHKAGALVDALQVIEIQEKVDAELLAAGEGGSRLVKRWRRRCMQQIASSVQESFAPVLQQSSKVVAAGSESGVALSDVLQTTGELVLQLKDAHAHVVPCFPPQYKILTFVCEEYHRHVGSVIDLSGLSAAQLSNGDILRAMAWVSEYQAAIAKLGVTPETYKFDGEVLVPIENGFIWCAMLSSNRSSLRFNSILWHCKYLKH
jgi:exocyst complex component 3